MSSNPVVSDVSPTRPDLPPEASTHPEIAAPPAVPRWPARLVRAGQSALLVGALCAALGLAEGAFVGSILASRQAPGDLMLAVAIDRGILLGLVGAVFGALLSFLPGSKSPTKPDPDR
jgi:hypothetical protein